MLMKWLQLLFIFNMRLMKENSYSLSNINKTIRFCHEKEIPNILFDTNFIVRMLQYKSLMLKFVVPYIGVTLNDSNSSNHGPKI